MTLIATLLILWWLFPTVGDSIFFGILIFFLFIWIIGGYLGE